MKQAAATTMSGRLRSDTLALVGEAVLALHRQGVY